MSNLILLLILLFLLATRCRRGQPGWDGLLGWDYAHRGLHGEGVPENSMAAFRAALDHGYGVELDIHLLKDGNLAVIHDSLLNRTTGQVGRVEDLTTEQLKDYHLQGTDQTIPEFMDVLELFQGKAPMIVELKSEDGNADALTEAACKMLDTYTGPYCLESFDPKCLIWLRKHRPELIRGQLSYNYFRYRSDVPDMAKFALTHHLLNFVTVPDFIAYGFAHRKDSFVTEVCRKLWKVKSVAWTIRSQEDYDTAVAEGWIPIFEGFIPEKKELPKGSE